MMYKTYAESISDVKFSISGQGYVKIKMAVQRHLEKRLKYFYGYLKTNKKTSYTSSKSKWLES